MKFLIFFYAVLLSVQVQAVDLDEIFAEDSKVPPLVQEAVKTWFKESCGNMNWVLSIKEDPEQSNMCSDSPVIHEVYTHMELSHLKSLFVFWVKEDEGGWYVDALYEEHPAWQICHYPVDQAREDTNACY